MAQTRSEQNHDLRGDRYGKPLHDYELSMHFLNAL